jgi:hypothetical protein
MLETLLQNPAFLILIGLVALVIIFEGAMTAYAFLRGQRDDIAKTLNRDQKAMDELHKRVEELKEKK